LYLLITIIRPTTAFCLVVGLGLGLGLGLDLVVVHIYTACIMHVIVTLPQSHTIKE